MTGVSSLVLNCFTFTLVTPKDWQIKFPFFKVSRVFSFCAHTHTHTHTTLQDSLDQAGQLQRDKDELLKQVVALQEQLETVSKEKEKLSKQVCEDHLIMSTPATSWVNSVISFAPFSAHRFPTLRSV